MTPYTIYNMDVFEGLRRMKEDGVQIPLILKRLNGDAKQSTLTEKVRIIR